MEEEKQMALQGLTTEQVRQRMEQGLHNAVTVKSGRSEKDIILQQCLSFFNLVFIVLALILVLTGSNIRNMTFMVIVVINTAIGIIQEIRAKRAVDKLTLVAAQHLPALRDGKLEKVRSDLLVQDDIVEFHAGDQICADGLVCSGQLQVNEALLTGEADAVEKNPGDELKSGSFVIAGTGRARLTNVGNSSFAAKLALAAKADPKAAKSEMMDSLDKLIRVVGIALIPVGMILFFHQFKVLDLDLQTSAEGVVATLVGMIPEGLYLLTSMALAVSAIKLTRNKVLVQDMNCVETLARVDVLCVDKTGTITEPVMEVENIIPLSAHPHEYFEKVMTALYGSRQPDNDTAAALQEVFSGESPFECTGYIPFTSQTKWSAGTFKDEGTFLVGAPEIIMGRFYHTVSKTVEELSNAGLRVLLVARYDGVPQDGKLDCERVNELALITLSNRLRPNARKTLEYFRQQGVTVKVISGDSPATASQVALRAGIENAESYVDATTLSDEDVYTAAGKYTVFGRVTPDMKRKLVKALKKRGHTVAMTGDGVNDVLAMKDSDCGVAMASGAQAASQVARLVLMDSDFTAMPGIVGEGRRVINNIQRASSLFLVKNIFSLGMALMSLIGGWALPLEPFHLSIVAALTIGVPSFFLALEPNYERVHGKFLPTVIRRALPGGLTNILVVLICNAMMHAFGMPLGDIATVCTAVLSAVGMMVLFKVSTPFNTLRKVVWGAMLVALCGCFLILSEPFGLTITQTNSYLVMAAGLVMVPTVFFVMNRLFELTDRLWSKMAKKSAK